MTFVSFPKDFIFGSATAAYQIEGGWDADGKGPSIWDVFSQKPGNIWQDATGNIAADHYHRYKQDVALMKEVGLDSYRLSFSWSRIMPDGTGQVNRKGLDFYHRLIEDLLEAGIAPNVTLYHWDLPQALQDRGGWPNRDVASWFGDYAALVFSEFSGLVPRWATLNEPVAQWVGYGLGLFAPGIADPVAGKAAMYNSLLAHGTALQAFRAEGDTGAEAGIVVDIWKRVPKDPLRQADVELALDGDDDSFRFFLDPLFHGAFNERLAGRMIENREMPDVQDGDMELISKPIDYYGLNVYSRVTVSAGDPEVAYVDENGKPAGGNFLDYGSEFYPKAVYDAVKMVEQEYGFSGPIIVTENGTPISRDGSVDELRDQARIDYVSGFLTWIKRAIDEGSNVTGYYLWSFIDTFEWTSGYSTGYGLHQVDRETLERRPKDSAHWYKNVIANRGFNYPDDL